MDGQAELSRVQHLRGLNVDETRTGGGSSSRKGRRRVEGRHEPQKGEETLTKSSDDVQDGKASDRELCAVCAEQIENFAFGICSHVTCANCTHRMRTLYKMTECVFCKTQLDEVVVVPEQTDSFQELRHRCVLDEEVGMRYEDIALQEHYRGLRRPTCVICGREFAKMHQLTAHLKAEHRKLLCEVCAAEKVCYTVELDLFDDAETLKRHRKAHPFCQFCKKYVLDSDALFLHLQREHESCSICEQDGRLYEYYRDYQSLENHYHAEHFTCPEPSCRGQVFRNAVDLRIHESRTHGTTGAGGRSGRSRRIQMGLAEFQGGPANMQRENQRRNFQPAMVVFQSGTEARSSRGDRSAVHGTSGNRATETRAPEQQHQQHQGRQRSEVVSDREGAGNRHEQAPGGGTAAEPPARPVMPLAPADKAEENARNQQLLSKLRGFLDAADFELFRDLSGRFRDGSISAEEYFREAESILGRDARTVLPELTALLRDDSHRSSLSRVVRSAYRLLEAAPVERVDAAGVRHDTSAVDSNSFPALSTENAGRHIVATRGGQQWNGPSSRTGPSGTPGAKAPSRRHSGARAASNELRDVRNNERTSPSVGGSSKSDHESWTRSADRPGPSTEPLVAAPVRAQGANTPAQEEMFPALERPVGRSPAADPSMRAGAVWGGAARKVHDSRRGAASASQRAEAQRQQSQNLESAFPALAPRAGIPTTALARRASSERDYANGSAADFPQLVPVARAEDVGPADGSTGRRAPALAPAGAARVYNLADLERARRDGSRHFVPKIGSNGFNWDKKKEEQRKQKAKEELAEREKRQQEKDAKR